MSFPSDNVCRLRPLGNTVTGNVPANQMRFLRPGTAAIERAQLATRPQRLSAAALETLALIAYRQPVGRAEIEEVRGVSAANLLKTLLERGLIDMVGRSEGIGRPMMYGTTPAFLEQFSLRHLGELPRAEELAVALRAIEEAPVAP